MSGTFTVSYFDAVDGGWVPHQRYRTAESARRSARQWVRTGAPSDEQVRISDGTGRLVPLKVG